MRTKRTMGIMVILLGFLLSRDASAFYNPHTGRWLSRDLIGERGGEHLYAFVGNESLSRIDIKGLVRVFGPSYIYGTANGPIGPGKGAFGLTRWFSGVSKLKRSVACNLCCLDEVEFFVNLTVYLPVVGDVLEKGGYGFPGGGGGVTATAQYVQNITSHEQVHVQHSLAVANTVYPAIESNCAGRCWRKPGGADWSKTECYDFLIAKMKAYDDMVTAWNVELGNDWHGVHFANAGGRQSYQSPVTAAHLASFQSMQDRKVAGWAAQPWCSDGDTCGNCIGRN